MMQDTQIDLIKNSLKELWRLRNIALTIFLVISMAALVAGWYWPRVYLSSSTVIVDEQNILQPLMEGTAVTTDVKNIAKNAKQLLSGQVTKDKLLEYMKEDVRDMTIEEKDQYWEMTLYKIKIISVGKGLISIEFKSDNPKKSQKIAAFFTELFISETTKNKRLESQSAYDFIAQQSGNYHDKLRSSEGALKNFRSEHLSASANSLNTVVARILELQRSTEETELEISEIDIQLKNITNQLSGEAEVSAYLTEEGQLQGRISALENQLDTLRMTFLDNYPDVIILKDQISALKMKMNNVRNNDGVKIKQVGSLNPLFQQLRSHSSKYKTQLAALQTRLKATNMLLEDEKKRARNINTADAELARLTRDYEVNRDIYQKLLRQRENARVSMNIDVANKGLTIKIQEMAVVPIRSIGIRLLHIAAIGLILAIITPFGLAYLMVMLDGKIRSKATLEDATSAPILGVAPAYINELDKTVDNKGLALLCMCIIFVLGSYSGVAWLRIVMQGN